MLGGFERNISSANFQGADLTAVMGGCEIDLRQSSIADASPVIDVFAFWGGVEIRVPQNWNLEVKAWPILGGVVDETEQTAGPGAPVVTVKGAAIMGGVGIKN
jgi:predicted membrane protein